MCVCVCVCVCVYIYIYQRVKLFPRRYPYFDVVVRLAWANDPESYADGSLVTGGGLPCLTCDGNDPDRKGHPGPAGRELDVGLRTPPQCFVEKLLKFEDEAKGCNANIRRRRRKEEEGGEEEV